MCSVHFRSGRPSNDPSHEDFVPHLYLSEEPPPEVMTYLDQTADKDSDCAKILAADASVELIGTEPKVDNDNIDEKDDKLLPLLPRKNRNSRPAIMQRKRKIIKDEIEDENFGTAPTTEAPPKLKKIEPAIDEVSIGQAMYLM